MGQNILNRPLYVQLTRSYIMEKDSCELRVQSVTINLWSQLILRFMQIYKAAHKMDIIG